MISFTVHTFSRTWSGVAYMTQANRMSLFCYLSKHIKQRDVSNSNSDLNSKMYLKRNFWNERSGYYSDVDATK